MKSKAKAFALTVVLAICAAAVIITHLWSAHEPAPAPRELYSAVNRQLLEFRASDFAGAYHNASSGVQQKFSLTEFEAMVRQNYAAMTECRRVEFGSVQTAGATAIVNVFFFDDGGSVQAFVYDLVAEDGSWKIAGVERIAAPRAHHTFAGLHA